MKKSAKPWSQAVTWLALLLLILPNRLAASAPLAELPARPAGTPVQIVYGTDVTFTTMNYHDTAFLVDPNNPSLDPPASRSANANGGSASASNLPSIDQAGVASATVGLEYDLLPGEAAWDDIKDLPLNVTVNFSYTLNAQYTPGEGSANAGLAISPLTSPWYDFLGTETTETGSRSDVISVTYQTSFDDLGDKLFLVAYSQAHLSISGTLSSSSANVNVTSIAFDFAPLPPDLSVDAMEVTQAVQDLSNSVRLVADKRTFVRLHVSSNSATFRTFAHLEIEVGPIVHTIYPSTPGYYVNVRSTPDRGMTSHAFLFEIPIEFTSAGDLEIVAVLNPDNAWRDRSPVELTYSNNALTRTVTFETVPAVGLVVHQMIYNRDGSNHAPSLPHALALPDWMRRAFPLNKLNVWHRVTRFTPPAAVDAKGNLTTPTCEQINAQLLSLRRWERVFGSGTIPAEAHYYGMVAASGGFMRGCADLPGYTASGPSGTPAAGNWDTDGTYGDWYGAHELAHSYGRGHANYCTAAGGPAWPYSSTVGSISPVLTGSSALFGFDIKSRAIYDTSWKDVMTYCPLQWISDYTYEALMDVFQATVAAADVAGPSGDYLTIAGIVDLQTGDAEMQPVYLLEDVTNPQPPTPGPYAIILQDSGGDDLATYMFTPRHYHSGAPNPNDSGAGEQEFLLIDEMVPNVAGTASIDITGPGGLLDTITAGPATPAITVTAPNGGEVLGGPMVTVTWDGYDPDGDPLTYQVQYSPDAGASWTLVAAGVLSETTAIDTANLKASPTALFRVWASDGLHSASDESNATFGVPNHPPVAFIEEPATNITVVLSETVGFKGLAFDFDTGPLGLGMLTWTSSLDGIFGPGDQVSWNDLSLGVHTITFKAEDGEGGVMTDTVVVTVVGNPTFAPAVANQLVAGPITLDLGNVAAPVTDTLFIENQNLDNVINWQAAVTATWLSLTSMSGATPAEIILSYDPASLPAGFNLAKITLTSADVPGQLLIVFAQIFREADLRLYLPLIRR